MKYAGLFFLILSSLARADIVTLEKFLAQVKAQYPGYKAAEKKSGSASSRKKEAGLMFSPAFFTKVTRADDKRFNWQSTIPITRSSQEELEFGLMQQTRYGLQLKLFYDIKKTKVKVEPPEMEAKLPFGSEFYDGMLGLEASLPLWKNWFGRDDRLLEKQAEKGLEAKALGEKFTARMVLIEAERVYWRLALAQQMVRLHEETYDRTRKLMDWQQRRADDHLSDQADLLAAQAALKGRQVELTAAKNENRLALKAFNQYLGRAENESAEVSLPTDTAKIVEMKAPARSGERDDVKAQSALVSSRESEIDLVRARYDASLDIFARSALTSTAHEMGDARKESTKKEHPLYYYGMSYSIPLDRGLIDKTRRAYLEELEGEKLGLEDKRKSADHDWQDLSQQFADAKETLSLVTALEGVLRQQFNSERDRIKVGRTTTYQLFLVEQDYLKAQKNRAQAITQVLVLAALMKSFQDGDL